MSENEFYDRLYAMRTDTPIPAPKAKDKASK